MLAGAVPHVPPISMADMDDLVRLVAIHDTPLDVAAVLASVEDDANGGVCSFIGVVRDKDSGKHVEALEYSAHPTAIDRLRDVCTTAAAHHGAMVAAVHRVGDLQIGDVAVVVAASAPHRTAAFDAARELIDTLKAQVPIWKHQTFSDGTQQWVGTPE